MAHHLRLPGRWQAKAALVSAGHWLEFCMTDTVSRSVYFCFSESTGITAEAYGQSLLSQFGDARFIKRYTPFINTREKAQALANELAHRAEAEGKKPIVSANHGRRGDQHAAQTCRVSLLPSCSTASCPS